MNKHLYFVYEVSFFNARSIYILLKLLGMDKTIPILYAATLMKESECGLVVPPTTTIGKYIWKKLCTIKISL